MNPANSPAATMRRILMDSRQYSVYAIIELVLDLSLSVYSKHFVPSAFSFSRVVSAVKLSFFRLIHNILMYHLIDVVSHSNE